MIHNDEHEPITVFLDYKPERHARPFYCCKCGKCVCEITGNIVTLTPGYPDQREMDEFKVANIIKCSGVIYMGRDNRIRCTAKYLFT